MDNRPTVSVIIPTHDSSTTIRACLESVFANDYSMYEVIVTDDASNDDTLAIAAGFPCTVERSSANIGSAAARNAGARSAQGTVLMFVDSDVVIPRDAMGNVVRLLSSGEWDAVVGMLDREVVYPNLASFYKNAYMHYTYSLLPPEMGVFYTSAAAVTREAFWAVGGFDEHYRKATIEDTELGGRMRAAGCRIKLEKTLAVKHLRYYSLAGLLATGFLRTSGVVKIMLRAACGRTGRQTYLTSPRQFTTGIALTLLAALSLLVIPFAGIPFLVLPLCFVIASCVLNRGFLAFILRERGAGTAVRAAPLMIADQFFHGLGALHGVITFFLGKRY